MSQQIQRLAADVPVDDLPSITLTDKWRRIVQHVARGRELTYEDYDGTELYEGNSLFETHRTGATGEIALQLWLNRDPEIFITRLGDGGYDFKNNGHTVDVKATRTDIDRPKLAVKESTKNWADMYVLTQLIDWTTVRIVGYCTRDVVKKRQPRPFPYEGSSESYVVSQDELRVLE